MLLSQLEYFTKVVECQSINKAAEQLFVSQPNLSKAIKALEEELNMTLLIRHSRGIDVTSEGSYVYHYCKMILKQTHALKEVAALPGQERPHTLILSTTCPLVCTCTLSEMMNAYPRERFDYHLLERDTKQTIEDVANFNSEVGIIAFNSLMKRYLNDIFIRNGLTFTPIYTDKVKLLISKDHPLAKYDEIEIDQLAPYPIINGRKEDLLLFDHACSIDGRSIGQVDKVFTLNSFNAQLELIRNNQAYKITGPWNQVGCESYGLKMIDIIRNELTFTIGYLQRKKIDLTDDAKIFIDILKEKALCQ